MGSFKERKDFPSRQWCLFATFILSFLSLLKFSLLNRICWVFFPCKLRQNFERTRILVWFRFHFNRRTTIKINKSNRKTLLKNLLDFLELLQVLYLVKQDKSLRIFSNKNIKFKNPTYWLIWLFTSQLPAISYSYFFLRHTEYSDHA